MLRSESTIRFFADWGHPWPLWSAGAVYPGDIGLTQELSDRLERWVSHWQTHHQSYQGWDSAEAKDWSDSEGDALVSLIEQEAPMFRIDDRHRS